MEQNSLMTSELFSKGYGFIPKIVMIDTDLTVEAKAIYGYLASYSGAGMSSYPSTKLILNHLNMSRDRYFKHRKQLIEKGYITIKKERKNGDFCNNIYILNSEPTACTRNATTRNATTRNATTRNATTRNATTNSISSNNNSINSNSLNIKPSNGVEQKETSKESELKERFEAIWKLYPNKKGKRRAYPSYKAAIKEGTTDEQIITGIEAYIEECRKNKTSKDYMMHGSTFFYQRRWEDDYNIPTNEAPKKVDYQKAFEEYFAEQKKPTSASHSSWNV